MPALVNGDLYQIRYFTTCQLQTAINVRHVAISNVVGTPQDTDLVAAMSSNLATLLKNMMTVNAVYRGCGAQRLLPAPPTVEVYSTVGTGNGAIAGTGLPKQTCGVITLRTAFAGRKFRGRFYVPFPDETSNTDFGVPTTGYRDGIQLVGNAIASTVAIVAGGNTANAVPVVFSRVPPTFTTPLSSATARLAWGTQRKRGDFGRTNPSPI